MTDGGREASERGDPAAPWGAGAPVPDSTPAGHAVSLPGPDVQRLGRWVAVGVAIVLVVIVVVFVVSAMF